MSFLQDFVEPKHKPKSYKFSVRKLKRQMSISPTPKTLHKNFELEYILEYIEFTQMEYGIIKFQLSCMCMRLCRYVLGINV